MGVDCTLRTEQGEILDSVEDPTGVVAQLIPALDDERYHCWRFIDPYGDTVFNRLQMERFISEIEQLRADVGDPRARLALERIGSLARECRDGVHLHLKFLGD